MRCRSINAVYGRVNINHTPLAAPVIRPRVCFSGRLTADGNVSVVLWGDHWVECVEAGGADPAEWAAF